MNVYSKIFILLEQYKVSLDRLNLEDLASELEALTLDAIEVAKDRAYTQAEDDMRREYERDLYEQKCSEEEIREQIRNEFLEASNSI